MTTTTTATTLEAITKRIGCADAFKYDPFKPEYKGLLRGLALAYNVAPAEIDGMIQAVIVEQKAKLSKVTMADDAAGYAKMMEEE